jgi:F0F1-type ATP synthase assembly protein I
MSALGIFLDKKLGTSFIMVIFFFIGAIAGGQNIYRMAKKIFDMQDNGQYGKDITAAERKEREN